MASALVVSPTQGQTERGGGWGTRNRCQGAGRGREHPVSSGLGNTDALRSLIHLTQGHPLEGSPWPSPLSR